VAEVSTLAAHIGAVLGSATKPLPLSEIESIRSALAEHLVVVLPGQTMDPRSLDAFMDAFGSAHIHHEDRGVVHVAGLPSVLELRKDPGGALFGGSGWHADATFEDPCGKITGLYSVTVPAVGGDTLFVSSIAAFEALSPRMQEMLAGLEAVHSYDGPGRPEHQDFTAVHPVVRRHPISGRGGLYVNNMFVTRFDGMTGKESRALLEFLEAHTTQPEFSCRVRWAPGQLVLWDNRFTLHYPVNDFDGQPRLLYRRIAV
jgi:taurine dioxygenase